MVIRFGTPIKLVFGLVCGWVLVALWAETIWRRWAGGRERRGIDLEAAYRLYPKTRPTIQVHVIDLQHSIAGLQNSVASLPGGR